jgi:heme/copper-type cytochrome/quinol oxidase subunit 2
MDIGLMRQIFKMGVCKGGIDMNKIIFGVFIIGLVLVFGCAQQTQPEAQDVEGEQIKETGDIKEFTMTAKKWDFTPSTITVNEGDTVKLTITSTDVTHGFSLSEFNINERLEPNQPVDVEFVADKAGTFTFRCNVPCGSGHSAMKGTLVVK